MKYLAYILTMALLAILAILPNFILYFISYVFSLILQYLLRYRKKLCDKNLKNSFPEQTQSEIKKLKRKFYRHLADVILENAVMLFYSEKKMKRMFSFKNPELLHPYFEKKQHIVLMLAHYNNWEWASPLSYEFKHQFLAVYQPLRNPYFEKAYMNMRSKFGAEAVPMNNIGRVLVNHNNNNVLCMTGMVGDQRPLKVNVKYWTNFLNQKTAMHIGSEKLAKKFNAAVIFMKVRKLKKGRYQAEFEIISDKPKETNQFEITEKYAKLLENLILEEPAHWLWSHNRWKISYDQWLNFINK